jgi:hypothetical protein
MYKTVILPAVFYELRNWSVTLREGCGWEVYENKLLRRIFGTRKKDVKLLENSA